MVVYGNIRNDTVPSKGILNFEYDNTNTKHVNHLQHSPLFQKYLSLSFIYQQGIPNSYCLYNDEDYNIKILINMNTRKKSIHTIHSIYCNYVIFHSNNSFQNLHNTTFIDYCDNIVYLKKLQCIIKL